ncbi:preprotein translocase subunit SecG [Methylobacterium indicum]|uniref:Protein-export membrane protein SecG n=1 Tax=Methylobacterium indicum TaxID=1775910 RepID=A0ABR5GU45_9HYPH|nr:preprotein translocase subunit SecG [Methylobacterium indicum]KMO10772.1 preprotein translocase subunit SecG [Methylobacterium indicum]KMO13097.1 preprotein translocase subunit SecG [Methylobacterium indicum]KTS19490.1 preprotein translocase subunit SecG [Methylobacterium indicum]KTS34991.1 preprotein translocase subunit SecG [Methylobacterium indicum]KTS49703.1 preprotein translocase subunit SecG [Methylobacterium indicum]
MQTVLIVVHLIIVLALIGVVLLQRSEGGLGLGGGGGTQGFMTGRGQANALTRATAILAALFFTTSMILAIMSHRGAGPRSIFEGTGTKAPAGQTGAPPAGNVLDQLRQQQGDAPAAQTPAAQTPAAPAPAAPAAPAAPTAPQSR